MVILITGASHTGKTILAQRLLEKYKYPYLSIDHLKMGLIRSGMTALTPEDDDALTDELWPIVREMVKTAIENLRISLLRAVISLLVGAMISVSNTCIQLGLFALQCRMLTLKPILMR